ncbi:hypothetical protein [Streptomyces sp. NPDC087862]|uniref:hypothetical protein n=1 Tax=Streptomyces sp. NPDC087862 TaxID=3365813 RepID=UPI0037FCCDAB
MIPQLVTVGRCRPDGRRRRLYVPVLPVLLVLSPLLLLAVPVGLVACHVTRVSPVGAVRGTGNCCAHCPAPGSRSSRAVRPG